MLVFLDTEFTDFIKHDLISIALVAEDGREFYAERTDFKQDECSDFVRKEVLPVLHRVSGAPCDRRQLTRRLHEWFGELPEPATLIFDFEGDWLLLVSALLDAVHKKLPPNVGDKLHLDRRTIAHPVFDQAKNVTYTPQWPPHHALADARALMSGYHAWKAFMEPIKRIQT
ncbi:3'-5' exoribonuclease [Rhodoferax sp. U11-2br]|uniref:3'-5' exoribonuclease n=1 Tax=Rhodoferax sp. U11-2br TaxID=2838878 RepID=UPI001BE69E39|nr:3'-5' exoribonuclease [Rhodoferax sp. U11-2br]MBT3066272.1 3'-5' exoribonuclease [Rhodoferax sp. U11-2br]